jgi:hypothetical protein
MRVQIEKKSMESLISEPDVLQKCKSSRPLLATTPRFPRVSPSALIIYLPVPLPVCPYLRLLSPASPLPQAWCCGLASSSLWTSSSFN